MDLHKIYEEVRKTNQERQAVGAKRRLTNNLEKKFKTTIIGILARCEERFGFLWGHGLDEDELTREQIEFREVWELLRTEILNHGNNQLRGAIEELSQYTINWNKYRADFIIKRT